MIPIAVVVLAAAVACIVYCTSKSSAKRKVERFVSGRPPEPLEQFVESLPVQARDIAIAEQVRRTMSSCTNIPDEYIYPTDICNELMLNGYLAGDQFGDRFRDFATFNYPSKFKVNGAWTVSELIQNLLAAGAKA